MPQNLERDIRRAVRAGVPPTLLLRLAGIRQREIADDLDILQNRVSIVLSSAAGARKQGLEVTGSVYRAVAAALHLDVAELLDLATRRGLLDPGVAASVLAAEVPS